MADYDNSYKLLFSHREMVEDLLRGFVRESWVDQLDFATLEKASGSYVSDDLRDREDDVIWRVRFGDDWIYVYILLEFQSQPDKYMAVRILTYLGLLYQDLIKASQLTPSDKLPPVLPIVLYNGEPRWSAAVEINELIESIPGGLSKYAPKMRYLLLEENELVAQESVPLQNLASALFRSEKSQSVEDMLGVVNNLLKWLAGPEQASLRRAFTVYFRRIILPAKQHQQDTPALVELEEVRTMLSERVKEWTKGWWNDGHHQGRQEGRQEGQTELVLTLLESKFGTLSQADRQRVESADVETLREWVKRILNAEKIEDILED